MQVDDLHDAVLKAIIIDLEAASIELALELVQRPDVTERVVLRAHGFEHCVVPRRQPWGLVKTWYVNEVRNSVPSLLEIEMQSGDIIEIHGGTCERIDEQTIGG